MLSKFIYNKKTILLLIVELTIFLFIIFNSNVSALSTQGVVSLTNSERTANGLGTLSTSSALNSSAAMKAQDMCDKNYWAHTSPDGLTGWTFMSQAGYPFTSAGENLAKDYDSDSGVVSGWMNSSSHRANMLNPSYTDTGVASLNCNGTLLVVAHYGVTANSVAPAPTSINVEAPKPAPVPAPVKKQEAKKSTSTTPKSVETSEVQQQVPVTSEPVVEPVLEPAVQPEVLAVQDQVKIENLETAQLLKSDKNMMDELWSYLAISMGFLGSIRLKMSF